MAAISAEALGVPETFNAATHFVDRNVAEGRGAHVAVECGDARLTYDDVLRHVNRCGNALRGIGVRSEDRVLLLLLDGPEFVSAFFGAIKIGAVPVPLNTLWKAADYEYVIRDTRAAVLIVSAELLDVVERIPDAGRQIAASHHRRRRRRGGPTPFVVRRFRSAGIRGTRGGADQPRRAGLLALLVGQHGRAQRLRAPAARHGRVRRAVRQGRARDPRGRSHASASRSCSLRTASATRCISPSRSVRRRFSGRVVRRRSTSTRSSRSTGRRCSIRCRPATGCCWPTAGLKACTTNVRTAPTLRAVVVRTFRSATRLRAISISRRFVWRCRPARRCRRRSTSASRSASASTSSTASGRPRRCTCSSRIARTRSVQARAGCIVPGYEARLLDDERDAVLPGEIGSLWIRGDSICAGYWNQHEKTKSTIEGHWIRTGDKYTQDVDGFYWYAGRNDDMLKVGGLWVSPVEVENALVAHGAVLESGVVGREDHDGLLKPMAFVVLRDGRRGLARACCRTSAVRSRAPRGVQATAVGGVRHRAAEDRHGQDPALQAATAARSGVRPGSDLDLTLDLPLFASLVVNIAWSLPSKVARCAIFDTLFASFGRALPSRLPPWSRLHCVLARTRQFIPS